MIYEDTRNVTFSLGSEDGRTRFDSQGGRRTKRSGQDRVRASHSATPETEKEKQTSGICGQFGSSSYQSAVLQLFLESRLRQRLPTAGLTMFIKGWNPKATPSGRRYCQLAVLVRPTSATGCGLWPTPVTTDAIKQGRVSPRPGAMGMSETVGLWATPSVRDHKDTGNLETSRFRKDGKERNDTLGRQAYGLTAPTENKGSLNPEFPCWLMGYPIEWENCADTVTPSSRKSPPNSSRRTYTQSGYDLADCSDILGNLPRKVSTKR